MSFDVDATIKNLPRPGVPAPGCHRRISRTQPYRIGNPSGQGGQVLHGSDGHARAGFARLNGSGTAVPSDPRRVPSDAPNPSL